MTDKNDSYEQMLDMWKEGQSAFLKAQKDVMESFQKSLSDTTGGVDDKTAQAYQAWQNFITSWAPGWDPTSIMSEMGNSEIFTSGRDKFMAMMDPANWTHYAPEQLRTILENIASGPQFADLATPQIDAANSWRETLDYQKATADMTRVLQEAWGRTFERFSTTHSLEDLQSGNVEGALDAWLKAANEELLETQRSQEFMNAQRSMLRSSMEIKARQRDVAENWSELYQIPTRTEIDDLTKIVHELRREVRKLKREVAANKSSTRS